MSAEANANALAMAEVFGVPQLKAYEAAVLANPSHLAEQLGAVVGNLPHHPMDPIDPEVVVDALVAVQDIEWATQTPEDGLAATGYHLGQLARLGFNVALTPKEPRNG